ncbi:MAG: hypothetical protein ACOC8O_04185, partial [Natronomonas sp.]
MTSRDTSTSSSSSGSRSGGIGPPKGTPVVSVDPQEVIDAIERPRLCADGTREYKGMLPMLDLPSFGEPDDDCGNFIPPSMYVCPGCSTVHEKPHNCYRYDCPLHWAHAVRRRAAGSKSGAGVAPQLDALRRYLNAYRDKNQNFHHLVISLGRDRQIQAANPLERERETIREIMDAIGVQGLEAYHPWAGDGEDPDQDDMGEWKQRIGKNTEWDDVREELEYRPHWHIIGVAHKVDFSDGEEIYEETGAVWHRILNEDDNNVSIEDDDAMCRATTYTLSHAGIYETDGGQRRLAAWMKGPDVNRITPLEKNKALIQAKVYTAAKDTLGIDPPNMECDNEIPDGVRYLDPDREESVQDVRPDRPHPLVDVWEPEGAAARGNGIRVDSQPTTATTPATAPSATISSWGTGGSGDPHDLPSDRESFESGDESGTSAFSLPGMARSGYSSAKPTPKPAETGSEGGSTAKSRSSSSSGTDSDTDTDAEECGTKLRHISKAAEYLLDDDWNQEHDPVDIENVETAYRSYVTWMEARGFEAGDDPTKLPEERDDDRPATHLDDGGGPDDR